MSNKNLVIVESPAKAKTIEGYLGKDYIVKSSFGHVRDLAKGDKAIDIANGFLPTYEISKDKESVVRELKKLAKGADVVWLATDDDREGEAISWHLSEALNLNNKETRRIVFREITKNAILNAIQSPRMVDIDLVNAQQARRVLDRLVGFELSPILWKKIKFGLSAGRVQSVAVRLVVERERDIQSFEIQNFFKVVADFIIEGNKVLSAELSKRFDNEEEANQFLESCINQSFSISDLDIKPAKRNPAPPFTTSTLQQEASRKLGYSVTQTMTIAQRLYESGKITYMRTDSVNLSDTAINSAKEEITSAYGDQYVKTRKFSTKSDTAQEAHEAIRPTEFSRHEINADRSEMRLYDLIWKRAIASQMAEAQLEKTTATVEISNNKTLTFKAFGEVVKFDGFLKVYTESKDEDDEDEDNKKMLPPLKVGQNLELNFIKATERFSRPPARYTEASLVKQLEEMGIGRPSTYAPTISTIQKRDYVHKEPRDGQERKYKELTLKGGKIAKADKKEITGADKGKLQPTDMAMIVTDFLVKHFPNVTNYTFTASIEKEFDEIAHGKMKWDTMISKFYSSFHEKVENTEALDRSEVGTSRELGRDPDTGFTVLVRLGKFGPMAQIGTPEELGEEKPKYASLQKGQSMETITFEETIRLFELPKTLGEYEDEEVTVAIGRFGPYVKFGAKYVSLEKSDNPLDITLERAIELIQAKQAADAPITEYEGLPVQKGVGRFGPFLKWNNIFINVNKKYDFDNLSQGDIEELIEDKKRKEIEKVIHNWEDEGIRVEKARWGQSVILKGKTKISLPKTVNAAELSLDEVKAIIEEKAPKKKKAAPKAKAKKK